MKKSDSEGIMGHALQMNHACTHLFSTSLRQLLLFFASQDAVEAKRSGRSFVRNCNTAK